MWNITDELMAAILTIPYELKANRDVKELLLSEIQTWVWKLIADEFINGFEIYRLGERMNWAKIRVRENNS